MKSIKFWQTDLDGFVTLKLHTGSGASLIWSIIWAALQRQQPIVSGTKKTQSSNWSAAWFVKHSIFHHVLTTQQENSILLTWRSMEWKLMNPLSYEKCISIFFLCDTSWTSMEEPANVLIHLILSRPHSRACFFCLWVRILEQLLECRGQCYGDVHNSVTVRQPFSHVILRVYLLSVNRSDVN